MRCSVFTPTNKPTYLLETYHSLCRQTFRDWEWTLVPNGACGELPAEITADPRVKLVRTDVTGVGALKRAGCDAASGDVLVELDHDDLLVPAALAKICQAVDRGAGFVHSDCAEFLFTRSGRLRSFTYGEGYGWETYEFWFCGQPLTATRAFHHSARSLCEILFAPNHVRAWTRDAYNKAGGHDSALPLGDDHDLVCRTYLAAPRFEHIREPLYLYRRHAENTSVLQSRDVWQQQLKNKDRYLDGLIRRWCERNGLARLQLKNDYPAAWLEARQQLGGHQLGHLRLLQRHDELQDAQDRFERFSEAWELLCPGGWLELSVTTGRRYDVPAGFQDVHHRDENGVTRCYFSALKGQKQPGWVGR